MDQHIPPNIARNAIETELEYFYQNILNDISNIPRHDLNNTKTSISTYKKYYNTRVPYKYQEVMKQLYMNKAIVIMKQGKGHGVVIMNQSKYFDKCLLILQSKQFTKLDHDPTGTMENKVQKTLRKIISKIQEKRLQETLSYRKRKNTQVVI